MNFESTSNEGNQGLLRYLSQASTGYKFTRPRHRITKSDKKKKRSMVKKSRRRNRK